MLLSLGLILLCQLIGEAVARATGAPVPGPVLGLILCVLLLVLRDWVGRGERRRLVPAELRDGQFEQAGSGLLSYLPLMFVPAGVGVIQRLDILEGYALAIAAAVIASTVLTLVVTALVFTVVARRA
ncbi:MAG TPA: CidA/LrgA family protein [Rhodopila sp.]